MKKYLLGLLLALASLSSFAGPAQDERRDFCAATAYTSLDVMQAKINGMGVQEFETKLQELIDAISGKFSKAQLEEIKHFLREAYAAEAPGSHVAQRIFDQCMSQKQV